ncbi:MAG: hypothetical protein LBQ54_13915 [Planctomycetaceae bacterium]|nr:hypothetical protein [Planctomycetaceae bacterium]
MKYLLNRLLILAAVLIVCLCSINAAVRKTLVSVWHSKTGLLLNLGTVRSSLEPTQVMLYDLEITDPANPSLPLGTAESVTVRLDGSELLRRRFLASEVRIHQLKPNLSGAETGLMQTWNQLGGGRNRWENALKQLPMKEILSQNPEEAAKAYAGQFEIAGFAEKVNLRWSQETESFRQQGKAVQMSLERIRQWTDSANETNDKIQIVSGILQELTAIDQELARFQQKAQQIPSRLQSDRLGLENAIRNDRKRIETMKEPLNVPKIGADFLSEYMLGGEMRSRIQGLLAWLHWGRRGLPEKDETWLEDLRFFSMNRHAGTHVPFPGKPPKAEVLFDSVLFDGQTDFFHRHLYFTGGFRNFSNQPKRLDKPMIFRFCVSGQKPSENAADNPLCFLPDGERTDSETADFISREKQRMRNLMQTASFEPVDVSPQTVDWLQVPRNVPLLENPAWNLEIPTVYVTAILDRSRDVPQDHILVYCPDYRLPESLLGNRSEMAFAVSPGISRFFAEIAVNGESIQGEFSLLQHPVRIQTVLPPDLRGTSVENVLTLAAESLKTLHVNLHLSGTQKELQFSLRSNLGENLAARMEPFLIQEWQIIHQKAVVLLNQMSQKSNEKMDAYFEKELQPILDDITERRRELDLVMGQNGIHLDRVINAQIENLSPKDQQRAKEVLQNPLFQSLLNRPMSVTEPNLKIGLKNPLEQKAGEWLENRLENDVMESIHGILGSFGRDPPDSEPPRVIPVYP